MQLQSEIIFEGSDPSLLNRQISWQLSDFDRGSTSEKNQPLSSISLLQSSA